MDIRYLRLLLASLFLCGSLYAAPPTVTPSGRSVPGEVLVKFQSGTSDEDVSAVAKGLDADQSQRLSKLKSGTIWRLHSRSQNTEALTAALAHNPNVAYAEPNFVVSIGTTPNDPYYTNLWGLNNTGQYVNGNGYAGADIGAEAAWSVTTGSASVVVGVVDTGVDYTHPDLAANVWSNPGGKGNALCAAGTHGFNAITGTCDPKDDHYHGTHVSGTIGAVGNNGVGVVGVNWTTSIMGLKFLDSGGNGTTANAITAIDFAVQAKIDGVNVRVLSNSWGGGAFSKALLDEINKAGENDTLFVASAGNDSTNNDFSPHYPANYGTPNLISVAATDNRDVLAYFSDWGPTTVHLAAPGVTIYSCAPNNSYQYLSGTSMAAPHVSGTAALILANSPSLTTAQVKSAILNNVDALPNLTGLMTTGGRLNAARALGASIPPSFTLSVTPASRTLALNSSTSFTVTVNPKDGFNGSVQLSASNLPTGVVASFSPPTTSTSSILTLTANNSVFATGYSIQIAGTSGAMTRSTSAIIYVTTTPPLVTCGSFVQTATIYSDYLTSIATGDFDRDGFPDVVFLTQSNKIGIALGLGNGAFRTPALLTEPNQPVGVAVGDFNRDGKLDLAVADAGSSNITVRLGNGDGTFQSPASFAAGSSPFWIETADFNGDGKADLAVANNGSANVSILLGQGDGTFAAPVNYTVGSGPYWIVAGDFNNDGKKDLAVADYNANKISILLGVGDGTFQAAVHYTAGTGPSSIAAGDFNNDGKQDLAVTNYGSGTVSIFLGVGDGTFAAPTTLTAGSGATSVVVSDVNGDGNADLLVASTNNNAVTLWRGVGDGTFASTATYTITGPVQVVSEDLDRDGRPDMVVAAASGPSIAAYLNTGVCTANCGAMAAAVNYGSGSAPQAVIAGDFNHDGKLDIATANNTANTVSVALGQGDGTFQAASDYSAGSAPRAVKAADVNGDGRLDLIVADSSSNQVSVLLGNSNGTFQGATTYGTGTTPHSVAVGDFNRDGKPDLAVANSASSNVSVLLGNGDGTFQTAVSYGAGTTPESVVVADFNRDGKADLAVANSGSGNVSLLLGNGDGTFQTATTFSAGTTPLALAAADLNHDGKLDLIVANSGSGNVSVLLGNGAGSFAAAVNYTAGTNPYALVVGDFNRDGLIDVAVALNGGNAAVVLTGTGSGALSSPVSFSTGTTPYGIAAGDFNHDGTLDLAVANSGSNNVSVLLNSCPAPDLSVGVVHNGTFTQGDSGKTYTITASNVGGGATSGTVSVTDSLPSGIVATAISGSGWTCTLAPLGCTRSDTLAGGAGFPPITVTVNIGSSTPASVTNSVLVSGGGELNTFNDSASDVAPVGGTTDLTVSVAHTGSFTQGSTGKTYSIVVRSAGRSATSGQITVTDSLPSGLTATGLSGTGWACSLGSLTCTRSDSLAGNSNAPAITLTVNVDAGAPTSVINSATVSGGGETITNNDTATDTTVIWSAQTCGTFGGGTSYNAGQYPYEIAKGDFNHDGKIDVVTGSSYGSSVSVLLGGAGGTFAAGVNYTVGSYPEAVAVGDFNGDGNLDIATANYYGNSISILLGNGDGTFAAAITFATLSGPTTITIADFNGDGNADIAVAGSSSLAIHLGNGNGTFQTALTSQPGSYLVGVTNGDFDGDGKVDLVLGDNNYNYTTNSYNVLFLKGNGDGTFQTPLPINVGPYPNAVYAADFNGDGKLDIAVARSSYSAFTIVLGNGNGTFQTALSYYINSASRIAIDDINGDGKLDIAAVGYSSLTTLLGNGDGTFQTPNVINFNYYYSGASILIGDFNGDGRADFAITNNNYSGSVVVFLGACPDLTLTKTHTGSFTAGGTGTYTITVTDVGGNSNGLVAVTDIVPDGLLITNMSGSNWACDVPNSRCTINQTVPGGTSLPPITVTVSVSKTAPGNVVNQATVSSAGDTNNTNDTAYDSTTIVKAPDLTVSKSHNGSFVAGDSGRTYTIIVTNVGAASSVGTVTVSDVLPFGLTATGISGANWNCSLASLSCTRNDALAAGSAFPAIVLTVNVSSNATSLTNVANVSGGGDTTSSNNSSSDYTVVLTAPTNVVATAVVSSQVSVTWSAVTGAGGYQVLRSGDNNSFAVVGNVGTTSFLDANLAPNIAYFYKVRAVDATATGPLSSSDLAMTVSFSDDPITPAATHIRAVHITELRTAINVLRSAAGLQAATFTDASLSGKPVKAVHFLELQTALNQARGALLLPAITYSVSNPSAGNAVYGAFIRDLRNGLK